MVYSMFYYDDVMKAPGAQNCARYDNVGVNQLLVAARTFTEQARRAPLYMHANDLIHDDAPWIFINNGTLVRATRANLAGYTLSPLGKLWWMNKVYFK